MSNISKIITGSDKNLIEFISEQIKSKTNLTPKDKDLKNISELEKNLGNKLNILTIIPEKNKKYISVDQIGEALEFASKKPNLAKSSFLIVHPIEKLNLESQNKLLKLLEEPPEFLEIYLTGESKTKLLTTVKSRCETIELEGGESDSTKELRKELAKILKKLISQNEKTKVKGYRELQELVKSQSSNQEKLSVVEEMSKIIEQYSQARLEKISSETQDDISNIQKLTNLSDLLKRAVIANVNSKLILDKIFLDFVSIV
jgi:DNA polymerase III delta prime subunit